MSLYLTGLARLAPSRRSSFERLPEWNFVLDGFTQLHPDGWRDNSVVHDKPRALQQLVEGQNFWPRCVAPVELK